MGGPLSVDAALKSVRSAERGGVSVFMGDVRGDESGQPIAAIHYECYEEMALAEMARIVREAGERWNAAVSGGMRQTSGWIGGRRDEGRAPASRDCCRVPPLRTSPASTARTRSNRVRIRPFQP